MADITGKHLRRWLTESFFLKKVILNIYSVVLCRVGKRKETMLLSKLLGLCFIRLLFW